MSITIAKLFKPTGAQEAEKVREQVVAAREQVEAAADRLKDTIKGVLERNDTIRNRKSRNGNREGY